MAVVRYIKILRLGDAATGGQRGAVIDSTYVVWSIPDNLVVYTGVTSHEKIKMTPLNRI